MSGGWTATREPACRAFCSRNSAPTPAAAVAYSCQDVKNGTTPRDRADTALFINVAVSAYPQAAASPSAAARVFPWPRTPMAITIASKQPVTISVVTQTFREACVVPPDGAAAARPPPRLTVTRPTAHQVSRGSLRWASQPATSKVNGSSMMKMGWTRATGPVSSATAWLTAAKITRPIPASQTLRLIRYLNRDRCSAWEAGAVAAAIRCRTDAMPLHSAVSRANKTDTTAAS
ncbi:MAG: hypothetical protein ABSB76_19685 [Streptosporangiaceae bacterium]